MQKLLALAAIATLALTGCTLVSATGGGWMESAAVDGDDGNGKATFGFDINCERGKLIGEWVYHDKDYEVADINGVNAHGKLTRRSGGWDGPVTCYMSRDLFVSDGFPRADGSNMVGMKLTNVARPCPGGADCAGGGLVKLVDGEEFGREKEDWLIVTFLSGPYAGYERFAELQGGNLKVEQD